MQSLRAVSAGPGQLAGGEFPVPGGFKQLPNDLEMLLGRAAVMGRLN